MHNTIGLLFTNCDRGRSPYVTWRWYRGVHSSDGLHVMHYAIINTRSTSKWFFINIDCRCRNTTDRTQSHTGTVGRTLQRCAKPVIHNCTGRDRQHSTATADGRASAAPHTWWNYCSNQETFQWKSSRTRCDCCRNLQVRWNKPHKEPCKAIQQ